MNWKIGASTKRLVYAVAMSLAVVVGGSSAGAVNLIVNGGFEDSTSGFTTPPGWTNIGHTDGIVTYAAVSVFNLPAYEGSNFYSIGGPGNFGWANVGEGITQTVLTTVGNTYRLTFGVSDENGPTGISTLNVLVGGQLTQIDLIADGSGFFGRPLETRTIDYIATGSSTAISFTLGATNLPGNNDPLLDGISFEQIAIGGAVPEPSTWVMIIAGFVGVGFMTYRRRQMGAVAA